MKKEVPVIELQNVWKIYPMGKTKVPAVQGISLTIQRGEFVAIIGPSGSGKSTCMNLIGCLDLPTKGKILLKGNDISTLTEDALAEIRGKKIGFIFQQFNLIGTLTAEQNVMLPMIFQNAEEAVREKKAEELLSLVQLKERRKHYPAELSGGEQQRVAIARALANDPEIIIADEPTGNLDSKNGEIIINFLKEIKRKGKTIIIVTHDTKVAEQAEKRVYLKDGQIVKIA